MNHTALYTWWSAGKNMHNDKQKKYSGVKDYAHGSTAA